MANHIMDNVSLDKIDKLPLKIAETKEVHGAGLRATRTRPLRADENLFLAFDAETPSTKGRSERQCKIPLNRRSCARRCCPRRPTRHQRRAACLSCGVAGDLLLLCKGRANPTHAIMNRTIRDSLLVTCCSKRRRQGKRCDSRNRTINQAADCRIPKINARKQ